jgi:hypothetical protein
MNSLLRQCLSILTSFTVLVFSLAGASAFAQGHVVPLQELQQKLRSTAEQRTRNVADVERVLSYPAAAEALHKASVSPDQMRAAVATLSDAELARFADRARASEKDVQGGLIVGLLALIGLIVVVIVVVHAVAEARPPAPPAGVLPSDGGVKYPGAVAQVAPVNG